VTGTGDGTVPSRKATAGALSARRFLRSLPRAPGRAGARRRCGCLAIV